MGFFRTRNKRDTSESVLSLTDSDISDTEITNLSTRSSASRTPLPPRKPLPPPSGTRHSTPHERYPPRVRSTAFDPQNGNDSRDFDERNGSSSRLSVGARDNKARDFPIRSRHSQRPQPNRKGEDFSNRRSRASSISPVDNTRGSRRQNYTEPDNSTAVQQPDYLKRKDEPGLISLPPIRKPDYSSIPKLPKPPPPISIPLPPLPAEQPVAVQVESKVERTKLVIGIDFGTTYSGASYALVHPGDKPDEVDIVPIKNWDGGLPGDSDSKKVPSHIAYAKDGTNTTYWGFDIPDSLQEDTIKWFKLLLEPDKPQIFKSFADVIDPEFTVKQLKEHGMDAVKVASDYVRLLWQHIKQEIINQLDEATFDYATKSILLTVPAVWSDKAKHNTYLVAVNAGLAEDDYNLNIVAEPEAAAVAVLKDRNRNVQEGDVYVIVDAGGGTVDLTTYGVKSVKPLVLEEQIAGNGDICGAQFLSFNFKKLLRTYIGDVMMETLIKDEPETEARIIRDFEDGLRKRFDGTDSRRMNVAVPGVPDNPEMNIKSNIWKLTAAELNPIFLPVLEQVERLIRRQVEAIKKRGKSPKAILLVGGFGTNHYMFKRLQAIYTNEKSDVYCGTTISVAQPSIGWQSVAHGAVLCDVLGFGSLVPLRIARHNIGLITSERFIEGVHRPTQMYEDEADGHMVAKDTIYWFLHRGESLKSGIAFDLNLRENFWECNIKEAYKAAQKKGESAAPIVTSEFQLVSSPEDNASADYTTRFTRKWVTITLCWDLSKVPETLFTSEVSPDGSPYRIVKWTIHMRLEGAGMKFTNTVGGQYMGPVAHVMFHSLNNAGDDAASDFEDYSKMVL